MRPASASIHLGHLAYNFQLLQRKAGSSKVVAVVKANAYGHGLAPVATALLKEGCRHFAVTDANEGVLLRKTLAEQTQDNYFIFLLSGIFDASDAQLSQQHHLIPVISEHKQFQLLQAACFTGSLWLKVDTGMHRIGASDLHGLIKSVNNSNIHLAGIMSHLACADMPEHACNRAQFDAFLHIQETTEAPAYSLLNSAGIIHSPEYGFDFVRPGIALYGAEPTPSQPVGFKPVMQLKSSIIQVRAIQPGESVSYGGTWTATKATHIAVAAIGYADGLPRLLSNQGKASHHSGLLPIVGKICMDYCLLEVDNNTVNVGDEVTFFGYDNAPLATTVADQCQTIVYEIFTSISSRVTRLYTKEKP